MTLAPLVLIVPSYVVAFVVAPNTHTTEFQSQYQSFFSSMAVLLATVLVTLVVQASLFRADGIKPAALLGAFYIVFGEVAAMLSLSPGLDPTVARHAFALTVSAGVGSLAAVLFIAVKQLLADQSFTVSPITDGTATLESVVAQALVPEPPTLPTIGRRGVTPGPSQAPEIKLDPRAVQDLEHFGGLTERTVGSLMQQLFARPDELAARSKVVGGGWRALPLGRVMAVYRQLTPAESKHPDGGVPGVVVTRLVPKRELPRVLEDLPEVSASG